MRGRATLSFPLGRGRRGHAANYHAKHQLVPVDQEVLRLQDDEIVFDATRSTLPRDLARLLDVQSEIYNLTGKIKATRAALPRFFLRDDPKLLAALTRRRLPEGTDDDAPSPPAADPLDAFLSSRVLNWPGHGPDGRRAKVLMSLIDYMNHDSGGGGYLRSTDKSTFFVNDGGSGPGEQECFVRYGPYDAQDFLLAHGFIDTSARFLRSASFQVPVEDLGMLRVGGEIAIQSRRMTPDRGFDLSWSIPRVAIAEDGALEISSLYIVPTEDRSALRRGLTMALSLWGKGLPPETMARVVGGLEATVIQRTKVYLAGVRGLAENSSSPKARRMICDLVDFQTRTLAEYDAGYASNMT